MSNYLSGRTSLTTVQTGDIADDAVSLGKLAAGTDGELITWNASGDPSAVPVGTATHVLTSNGAGAAPTFQAAAAGGKVVQYKVSHSNSEVSGTTTMPSDNTIPQNTEGFEVFSLAITPTSSSNKLLIQSNISATATISAAFTVTHALFQDSTANALAATANGQSGSEHSRAALLTHYMTAGTTSETTFKVRIGSGDAGTLVANRPQGGGARYGGVSSMAMWIWELSV